MVDMPEVLGQAQGRTEQRQTAVPITPDTPEWEPNLDIALPIDTRDIPDFAGWVNWNGFNLDRSVRFEHDGFDFAAYYTTQGQIVFGLPKGLPIRAMADGTVANIRHGEGKMAYYSSVSIEHGHNAAKMSTVGSGLLSDYVHVIPAEGIMGQHVSIGDVIGHLYAEDEPREGGNALVHLHLSMYNRDSWVYDPRSHNRDVDPAKILFGLTDHSVPVAEQGRAQFSVPSLPAMPITNAHGFSNIVVNNTK